MEIFIRLQSMLASIAPDIPKFYNKGNEAAGLRIRKTLQEMKDVCQELRLDTLKKSKEFKNDD